MANDTKGFTTNSVDEVEGNGVGHPVIADPILIYDTITNETSTTVADIQDKEELDSSRLALISNKAYNGIWKKFSHWCQKQIPVQDPEEYNVSNVLGFLMEHNRLSTQTLNGYRSATASQEKDTEVRIPTMDKLETWDINILILYIRKELSPSTVLTLGQLQLKVILLMCINTMWRPRSDMGRIQWRDAQFTHTDGVPDSVRLHIRRPKKNQHQEYPTRSDPRRRSRFRFMELTNQNRQHLAVDHTLFLRYLEVKEEYFDQTVKRIVCFLTEHQTQIRNLKKQGFNIIGYARKSEGAEDNETRIKLLKLMCRRLKERSLVNHIFISYNSQAKAPLAQRDMK
ncbi:hypothetical protein G6F62_009026 [Rhizopus arrhizus]|nr:hypothetical protein G6F23_010742 [Rhizopus arrhizus]KAG1324562.1 hypothetical protein G6F62_009026 [Rhizopus arrhizus]KAG1383095.1 hypothetical protein G6F61_001668 [Rhizopus arrhizus]